MRVRISSAPLMDEYLKFEDLPVGSVFEIKSNYNDYGKYVLYKCSNKDYVDVENLIQGQVYRDTNPGPWDDIMKDYSIVCTHGTVDNYTEFVEDLEEL